MTQEVKNWNTKATLLSLHFQSGISQSLEYGLHMLQMPLEAITIDDNVIYDGNEIPKLISEHVLQQPLELRWSICWSVGKAGVLVQSAVLDKRSLWDTAFCQKHLVKSALQIQCGKVFCTTKLV